MCKFTFMNVKFCQKYDAINNKCFIGLSLNPVRVKEPKQHIPPKHFKFFYNIVNNNKITYISPEVLDNGTVPK